MTTIVRGSADQATMNVAGPTLHDYASFASTYRRMLVVGLLLGIVSGMGFHYAQPVRYTSTAHVVIVATTLSRSSESESDVSIDSALQVLRSDRVLVEAAQTVNYPGGARGLNDDLTTRPIVNSRIVRVSVAARDPGTARRAVTAVVDRFLDVRASGLRRTAAGRANAVSAEIDVVEAELARRYGLTPEGSLVEEPDAGATERITTGIAPLVTLRAQLHGEQAALTISEPVPGYLSRPATEPDRGARSGFAITMSSAVTLSLLLATCLGAVHQQFRDRRAVRTPSRPEGASRGDA